MATENTETREPFQGQQAGYPAAPGRLQALERYQIIDTPPEDAFDHITDLAAHVLDVPIAIVNFLDADRQWFKSCVGIEDIRETPLDQALCNVTIRTPGVLVVEDTLEDPRFVGNPFVAGPPYLRFYMGMPLTSPDGYRVGTVCVMDMKPRIPSKSDRTTLKKLAGVVMDELEMRATESQRAYRELQDREQRLRNFANSIPGVVFRARVAPDAETTSGWYTIDFVSGYAKELFGYPLERKGTDGAFRWLVDRIPASHQEGFLASIEEAVSSDTRWEYEVPIQTPEGTTRWIHGVAVPDVYEVSTGMRTYSGVLLDNTMQKKAEAQLLHAKQKAEEMSELKSAFLTNMGHEIRTPLTAIIGFAEVLQELKLEGPASKFSRLIHRSSKRLLDTLNTVLDLSQLEAASVDLQPAPLSASALVYDVAVRFRGEAKANDLTLHIDLPDADVDATLDREALHQVLSHLLDNAIKFTAPGGQVTVALKATTHEVMIAVRDTGIGMKETFVPHLFTAFKQASTGSMRDYEGNGLGLTVAKRLVELMHGSISVDTTLGEGSTFTVRLPRHPQQNGSTSK